MHCIYGGMECAGAKVTGFGIPARRAHPLAHSNTHPWQDEYWNHDSFYGIRLESGRGYGLAGLFLVRLKLTIDPRVGP
jgi:hypothetical protein